MDENATLSLFCWELECKGSISHKLSRSGACYTVCWMHSPAKCSGFWLFPPTNIFLGSVCYMANKKCCQISTLVHFLVIFCIQICQTLLFSICHLFFHVTSFAMNLKGVSSKTEIPSQIQSVWNCSVIFFMIATSFICPTFIFISPPPPQIILVPPLPF